MSTKTFKTKQELVYWLNNEATEQERWSYMYPEQNREHEKSYQERSNEAAIAILIPVIIGSALMPGGGAIGLLVGGAIQAWREKRQREKVTRKQD